MSFLSNLMTKMNLNRDDEDDYDLDNDYDFEDDYEEEEDESPKRTSFFSRRSNEEEEDSEPKLRLFGKPKSSVSERKASMEVTMIKPNSMGDATEICDFLLSGRAVVLNMEGLHTEVAQRIIDILSGTAYAINGNLQKISTYIFIISPEDVHLSGEFSGAGCGGDGQGSFLNFR